MKKINYIIAAVMLMSGMTAMAQSKTTEALQKKTNANYLYFYHNTLRMLNQTEDKAFDAMIENIEKMKLLMIKKESSFTAAQYKAIIGDYKKESFEEAMTSRFEGKNFDFYLKQDGNKTKGMLVMVNDKDMLYVLDIVGYIALDKVSSLYKTLEGSSEFGDVLNRFKKDKDDKEDKEDKD